MLRPLHVLGITLSVVFLGPIVFAALASFLPIAKDLERPSDALRLLRTFDDANPQGIPKYSMATDFYSRQCGYDSSAILGDFDLSRMRKGWTPHEGFYDLRGWINSQFYQVVEEARTVHLEKRLSVFELRFLDRCITNSAFSNVCGLRVRQALEQGDLYSKYFLPSSSRRPDQSNREKTMCAFLDGIAARKGQKLGIEKIASE
jgi:hypothetical protein